MPRIYYRNSQTPPEEVEAILRHFPNSADLLGHMREDLVVGRYSVLPFYRDVEREMELHGSRLINSYSQHRYIADFDWYEDLKDMTPQTWFALHEAPRNRAPFVVKGRTNSRKHEWDTHMYAETFEDAVRVAGRLYQDSLIGQQDIIVREYVPLRTLEVGLHGLPFSNEWRFFFLEGTLLSYGFYWTIAEARGEIDQTGIEFAKAAARHIAHRVPFFAIDIAEKAEGGWTVIEVNDGQMSGLSENDPDELYGNLARSLAFRS